MPDDETKGGRTPDTLDIAALPDDGWPPRHGRPHLRGGRHCRDGQPEVPGPPLNFWDLILYYWSLFAVFVSAAILAAIRWVEDYHLFILGALSFAAASWGRIPVRRSGSQWVRFHIRICRCGKSCLRLRTGCCRVESGCRSSFAPSKARLQSDVLTLNTPQWAE